jgi:hypothetical protein
VDNPLIQLQELFRTLAHQVVEATEAEPKAIGWNEVTLDARYSPSGTMQLTKIRAKVAGQAASVSVLYGDIDDLVDKVRKSNLGEPFFGFTLTISAEGKVDIRLNYDPNCYTAN